MATSVNENMPLVTVEHAGRVARIFAVAYLLVVTFPGEYTPVTPGLDASWIFGINYLRESDYIYGRDVAYTYGPLGYLLHPLDIGSNLIEATIFRLIIHLIFAALLTYFAWPARPLVSIILFSVTYIAATLLGLQYETHLLVIVALVLCVSWQSRRLRSPAYVVAVLLGSLFLFMKFSLGLSALLLAATHGIVVAATGRTDGLRLALSGAFAGLLAVAGIIAAFFGSVAHFVGWLTASLELTDGYSVAMSTAGPDEILLIALLSLAVYGLLVAFLYFQNASQRVIAIVLVPSVLFAFKHGFVRQGTHIFIFFSFVLCMFGVLMLTSYNVRGVIYGAIACCLVTSGAFLVLPKHYAWVSASTAAPLYAGQRGLANLRALLDFKGTRARLNAQAEEALKEHKLPTDWLDEIRRVGGTVDALPWELGYVPANGLRWNPNPVLQTYSAYTAYLDEWSARHYEGPDAPSFVIAGFTEIDGRHAFMSAPATWRTILRGYEVAPVSPASGVLLLRRKADVRDESMAVVGRDLAEIGQWIPVPASERLLAAEIDLRLSSFGSLVKRLYQIPPVQMELIYESGTRTSYRIIPEIAKNGILVNYLPVGLGDLKRLFSGKASDRVVQIRISGPGAAYYDHAMVVTWKELMDVAISTSDYSVDTSELVFVGENTGFDISATYGQVRQGSDGVLVIPPDQQDSITVSGWAVDAQAQDEAGGVFVSVDGVHDIRALYGLDRGDVAEYFKNPRYEFSGFSVAFPASQLSKGRHTLRLKILTSDGKGYYAPEREIVLWVE